MKFIRFTLRDGSKYTFEFDKGMKILQSPQQLVMVSEEDGGWDGFSINKADVVKTERDYDAEKLYNSKKHPQLPEGKKDVTKIAATTAKIREELRSKGIITK
jgi:hypothetical protein